MTSQAGHRQARRWLLATALSLAAAGTCLVTVACQSAISPPGLAATPPASDAATAPAAGQGSAGAVSPGPAAPGKLLAGKIVGIDPGHNGGNFADPAYINQLIWNGREQETCDTTGTETASGYTEARYNFDVARYLRAGLEALGARVVMTRARRPAAWGRA